jgi:hypothetical protein
MLYNLMRGKEAEVLVRVQVIHAAGVENPRALAVVYTARGRSTGAVQTLREGFPNVPIYARALDSQHAAELKAAGATSVVTVRALLVMFPPLHTLGSCYLEMHAHLQATSWNAHGVVTIILHVCLLLIGSVSMVCEVS